MKLNELTTYFDYIITITKQVSVYTFLTTLVIIIVKIKDDFINLISETMDKFAQLIFIFFCTFFYF